MIRDRSVPLGVGVRRGWALVTAAVAGGGVWLLWRVFVDTLPGQRLDDAAFEGSEFGRSRLWTVAEPVLEVISLPFVALVLLAAMGLAVLRRRVLVAVQVAVLMAGANLTTQVLKRVVLERPEMGLDEYYMANTLPSGHTTAAASVAAALMFVVPRRLRPAAGVVGVAYTAATGVSTLVGRWHRPSDAVAAVLVVLVWAAVAVAIGVREPLSRQAVRDAPGSGVAALLLGVGALTGLGAAVALQRSVSALDGELGGRSEMITAYAGGALGVVTAVCVVFAVLLLLLRLVDPPRLGAADTTAEPGT